MASWRHQPRLGSLHTPLLGGRPIPPCPSPRNPWFAPAYLDSVVGLLPQLLKLENKQPMTPSVMSCIWFCVPWSGQTYSLLHLWVLKSQGQVAECCLNQWEVHACTLFTFLGVVVLLLLSFHSLNCSAVFISSLATSAFDHPYSIHLQQAVTWFQCSGLPTPGKLA